LNPTENKGYERLGKTNVNKYGSKMKIIEYKNINNVVVEFENGYKRSTDYRRFLKGSVLNVYDRSVLNIGYLGEGKYSAKKKAKLTLQYIKWAGMLKRCYSKELHIKEPSYKDCTVCEEWHNLQTFAKWHDENYYQIEDEVMCLDKDILTKGNKTYSPDTCIYVPQGINLLFTKRDSERGILPIGVCLNKRKVQNDNYIAHVSGLGDGFLGKFKTIEEAFNVYKKHKEQRIKQIADKYKGKIPEKLYDALYRYEIEITD